MALNTQRYPASRGAGKTTYALNFLKERAFEGKKTLLIVANRGRLDVLATSHLFVSPQHCSNLRTSSSACINWKYDVTTEVATPSHFLQNQFGPDHNGYDVIAIDEFDDCPRGKEIHIEIQKQLTDTILLTGKADLWSPPCFNLASLASWEYESDFEFNDELCIYITDGKDQLRITKYFDTETRQIDYKFSSYHRSLINQHIFTLSATDRKLAWDIATYLKDHKPCNP